MPDRPAQDSRSIVVTGASAGVGRAIALRFARAGARLTLIARSPAGLEATRRQIQDAGGQAIAFAADVADAAALLRAADAAAERWGGVDVWVNDAMVTMFAPFSEVSAEEFRRITEVTYLGYVHGTAAALRHMRRQEGGLIVQIGSALAHRAIPLQSAYCGAKFAVRGFTEALRSELLHEGGRVRLMTVDLPAVNTPQFDWARNVFPRKPQPVPPIYAPEAVAEAVYRASHRPPRELWLGLPTLKLVAGALAAPGLLDRYLARTGYEAQFTAEPDPPGRPDNLFEPVDQGHAVGGRFSDRARPKLVAFDPIAVRAVLALAGLLALAAVRRRR